MLELPHTAGCLVCGRENPHGLRLSLHVEPADGAVHVRFVPHAHHIGFDGIVHGGVIATVVDEAMVWAATWAQKRFCVCGEMTVRFRQNARVGVPVIVTARVEHARAKMIQTTCEVTDESGATLAIGAGKYVPVTLEQHRQFMATMLHEPATKDAARALHGG